MKDPIDKAQKELDEKNKKLSQLKEDPTVSAYATLAADKEKEVREHTEQLAKIVNEITGGKRLTKNANE